MARRVLLLGSLVVVLVVSSGVGVAQELDAHFGQAVWQGESMRAKDGKPLTLSFWFDEPVDLQLNCRVHAARGDELDPVKTKGRYDWTLYEIGQDGQVAMTLLDRGRFKTKNNGPATYEKRFDAEDFGGSTIFSSDFFLRSSTGFTSGQQVGFQLVECVVLCTGCQNPQRQRAPHR